MDTRQIATACSLAILLAALPLGCAAPDAAESVADPVAITRSFDCPAERLATVTNLHTPGGACSAARKSVGANPKSHHYRVACEAVQGVKPSRVDEVRAIACREDDRGAWTDVEICCPDLGPASSEAHLTAARLTNLRKLRLEVVAEEVGRYGTASVSLEAPSRPTEYSIRIPSESCDVFQLHPNPTCEAQASYEPGQTSTFMVRYTPGSTHRRGGLLVIDFQDPGLSDVEVRLSGSVQAAGKSGRLSVPVHP